MAAVTNSKVALSTSKSHSLALITCSPMLLAISSNGLYRKDGAVSRVKQRADESSDLKPSDSSICEIKGAPSK